MSPIVNQNDTKKLLRADVIFAKIHDQYGEPPNWKRPPGFVTLCKIILEQQISLESAKAHFNKLDNYIPSFTPKEILKLSDDEMRNCQISRQKSKYLRELSSAILDEKIDLGKISALPQPEIRSQLKSVKGIGDWTVDIYLLFCLQEKDIFPVGDIAIVNTVKELTNANSEDEIKLHSDKWKPYRSLATFYLWHYYLCKRNRNVI